MFGNILTIFIGLCSLTFGVIFINGKAIYYESKKVINFFSFCLCFCYLIEIIISCFPRYILNILFLLPVSNVSPMLFFIFSISLFFPFYKRIKIYRFMVAFIPTMALAAFFDALRLLSKGALRFVPYTIFDSLAHIFFFLFFYYLLKHRFLKVNFIDMVIAFVNMSVVILFIMIFNNVLHFNFFGLNFYGYHHIYSIKISSSGVISALLYSFGVYGVIFVDYLFIKNIEKSLYIWKR